MIPTRETPHTKHTPVRMCVICRQRFAKGELSRFTCPDGGELKLICDPSGKKPGRGFYICRAETCRSKFDRFKGWQKKCKGVGHVH